MNVGMYVIYVYIYIERERGACKSVYMYISCLYVHLYVHIPVLLFERSSAKELGGPEHLSYR